jgi:hypothetical protein
MINSTVDREQLLTLINALPDELLAEVANYADYLQSKTIISNQTNQSSNFLLSIVGLGSSEEKNVSDRQEEILANEIDPITGWSLNSRELKTQEDMT